MEVKEIKKKLKEKLKEIKKMDDEKLIDFLRENQIYRDFVYDNNGNKAGIEFRICKNYETDHSIWINSEYMELAFYKKGEFIESLPLGRELGRKIKNYIYDMYLARV